MLKRKRLVTSLILIVALVITMIASTGTAWAGYQGWHLVDSGRHMDYDGNSSYMSHVAAGANTWNAYKPGVIRQDSLLVIQDVYISDYTETSTTFAFTNDMGVMKFNTYHFSTMTYAQRQKTVTHELGHTLGLGHTNGSNDIMQQGLLSIMSLSIADVNIKRKCH